MGFAQLVIGPAGSGKVKSFTEHYAYAVGSCCELAGYNYILICFFFYASRLIVLVYTNTVRPWGDLYIL